ncbi:hypothetical protein Pfo_015683 [Paulownia fortunei]|nr:hypothetical protein Pfo_015683 [Paulownia fortunei]
MKSINYPTMFCFGVVLGVQICYNICRRDSCLRFLTCPRIHVREGHSMLRSCSRSSQVWLTAVDRLEGFLFLAVASLSEQITELIGSTLEEKKL